MVKALIWIVPAYLVVAACDGVEVDAGSGVEGDAHSDVVALDSTELRLAELEYAVIHRLAPDTLRMTGSVTFDAARVSHIRPRVQGRVNGVTVDIGSRVRVGQTLAVLDSPELGAVQAGWFKAKVSRDVALKNYQRTERLFADGIVSERRRLDAEAKYRQAEAALAAALQRLAALGAEPDSAASSLFVLRAPLSGIVVEKHATVGEVVEPGADLFTIGDIGQLWIILDLYESDVPRVVVNSTALLTAEAYPGRHFPARVAVIGAIVDSVSRTVKVRVEIPNPDELLKPGMFARAELVLSSDTTAIGVPRDAVQLLDGREVVFVPEGDGRFRIRPVRLGQPRAGGWIEVLDGLGLGDTVVARGSFSLKAQLQKHTFGEEGH
jgi:cobalt-zinc-cadmium efflux system membrane fusion protein